MHFAYLCATLLLSISVLWAEAKPVHPKVMMGNSEVARLLNKWYAHGTAAGNAGDYYDNRDGNHSHIPLSKYPQLSEITYTEAQKRAKADWGAQKIILPKVVVGNSSTSANVWSVGSMARTLYGASQQGLAFLHTQYRSNNLYIYPEHRDHDLGSGGFPGHGDLYMANSPYLIISQGSSGSDKKFLHACFQTLAAFKPEVKKKLIHTRTLMPTLQALLRKTYQQVKTTSDYLTGAAHPTVFNGNDLAAGKMIRMAQSMELNTIPPLVMLHVVDDDHTDHLDTHLDAKRSEVYAGTPASIARIFRRSAASMKIIVSAEQSQDVLGRSLSYHWVVLRGDPQTIHIKEHLGGAMAEITVPYPARSPITPDSFMESNRIDIGVFVSVDGIYSAPAFVTFFGLDNERRIYDRFGKLYSIAYNAKHQLNFPGPKDISRWHRLLRLFLFERDSDTRRVQMLFPTLSNSQIRFINKQASDLAATYEKFLAIKKELKVALNTTEKKDLNKQRTTIENQYLAKLNRHEPESQLPIITLLRQALRETTINPQFYLQHQKAIDTLLTKANPNQKKRFKAELQFMIQYGYFDHKTSILADDEYSLPTHFPHNPTYSNSRYQDFHAAVIATALAPDLFPKPKRINCVDPRLTKPKPFRDVLHYDSTGSLTGWTRYSEHGQQHFEQSKYTEK